MNSTQVWFKCLLERALRDVWQPSRFEGGFAFQYAIEGWFKSQGWQTNVEVPAPYEVNGKQRKGRTDLAVWHEGQAPFFIECDHGEPRSKSRKKLRNLGGGWVVCSHTGIVEHVPAGNAPAHPQDVTRREREHRQRKRQRQS